MAKEEIKLKVMEALQEEAYKGIVRIDSQTMKDIGVHVGDIIEIEGEKKTVGIVDRAYPTDIGQSIIRMDGVIRKNAKTGIGEFVKITKADVKEAKSITIAPAQKGIMVQADPEAFKQGLIGRAVVKGDLISLGGTTRRRRPFSGSPFEDIFDVFEQGGFMGNFSLGGLKFVVVNANPKESVIITENTQLTINPKATEVAEENEKILDVAYEDVGGLDVEVKKIREMVELPLKHPEIFEKLGVEPPKGVLLYGPPGTGKTLLAKAVANETSANFILINGPEIFNKFYGESEKKVREIFDEASKNAPSIIFIDELDAIAPNRDSNISSGEVERRVVSQLLTMMDGLNSRGKVIVMGATNRPDALDPALRRPGRFDREIEINIPDKAGRLNILKIHTRSMPLFNFEKDVFINDLFQEIKFYDTRSIEKIKILEEEITNLKLKLKEESVDKNKTKLKEEIKSKEKDIESITKSKSGIKKLNEDLPKLKKDLESIYESMNIKKHLFGIRGKDDPRDPFLIQEIEEEFKKAKVIYDTLVEAKILSNQFLEKVVKNSIDDMLKYFSSITHGFVGADLAALSKEAAMSVLRREYPKLNLKESTKFTKEQMEGLEVLKKDFEEALKFVQPSALREVTVETPDVKWSDVGGLKDLKEELREAVEWPLKNPEAFKRIGINPPKGILLYGPPGTGKTLLAKVIATESEANFIQINGPELQKEGIIGKETERLRKIFKRAKQVAPCIVFFDEIDSFARTRGGAGSISDSNESLLNTLLTEMDGMVELKDIFIIAATNRPDLIDPALLRPGRFDKIILTSPPNKEARLQIFKIHTNKMPLAKEVDLNMLAELTEGYVGSDIEGICKEAGLSTLRENILATEVPMEMFERAIEKIKPSASPEDVQKYKLIEEHYLKKARSATISLESRNYFG
ncbi:MAG: CDC48 family AAA ATPase [Candidatus Nanoarchaeia archaeon]|nr:CDC48 family AAA ATPase [Candidatus Nanoarchaeia archaeon]